MGSHFIIKIKKRMINKILKITKKYDVDFDKFINDAVEYYLEKKVYREEYKKLTNPDYSKIVEKFIENNCEFGALCSIEKRVFYKILRDEIQRKCNIKSDTKCIDIWLKKQEYFKSGLDSGMIIGMKVKDNTMIKNHKNYSIGSELTIYLDNKPYTAKAIREEEDGMIFMFNQIRDKLHPMKIMDDGHNDYQQSYIRELINTQIICQFPAKILSEMVPVYSHDYTSDLLRIPTKSEIFGSDETENNDKCFNNVALNITQLGGYPYSYWLMDSVPNEEYIYYICDKNGDLDTNAAFSASGIRLVFKLKNSSK